MSQFKAGDLALVVASKIPELIGKTVELVSLVPPHSIVEDERNVWHNTSSGNGWLVSGDGLLRLGMSGQTYPSEITLIAEYKLMPLRGDFTPETERETELVK